MAESATPAYISTLIVILRIFETARNGGSSSRETRKPISRRQCNCWLRRPPGLTEMKHELAARPGQLTETGLRRTGDGGLAASWALSWPEQRAAGVEGMRAPSYFGGSFHTLTFEERQFMTGR